jgi:hypothetical protein
VGPGHLLLRKSHLGHVGVMDMYRTGRGRWRLDSQRSPIVPIQAVAADAVDDPEAHFFAVRCPSPPRPGKSRIRRDPPSGKGSWAHLPAVNSQDCGGAGAARRDRPAFS